MSQHVPFSYDGEERFNVTEAGSADTDWIHDGDVVGPQIREPLDADQRLYIHANSSLNRKLRATPIPAGEA